MDKEATIHSYVNNFRTKIRNHLKPDVGIDCVIYPSTGPGAILEFKVGEACYVIGLPRMFWEQRNIIKG
jgi:hypothetical protein